MGRLIPSQASQLYRESMKYPDKSKRKPKRRDINEGSYKKWRRAVFIRDNYTCQNCQTKEIRLNAHHIKTVEYYPELELVLDNGITLCARCHKAIHKTDAPELPISLLRKKAS